MLAKPRYFGVAYPLVISALCVAPQDFFAKNWMLCIDLSVAKMKVRTPKIHSYFLLIHPYFSKRSKPVLPV